MDEPKLLAEIRSAADRLRAAGEPGWSRSRELEPYFAEIYRRAAREPVALRGRVLWWHYPREGEQASVADLVRGTQVFVLTALDLGMRSRAEVRAARPSGTVIP